MAYNDSGELPISQSTYSLGGYTFELKVQNVHEPGEQDVTSIFAICHSPDGTRETIATDFPAGTTVDGWYVEANETEASVYAKTNKSGLSIPYNIDSTGAFAYISCDPPPFLPNRDRTFTKTGGGPAFAGVYYNTATNWTGFFIVSDSNDAMQVHCEDVGWPSDNHDWNEGISATYEGNTFYYLSGYGLNINQWPNVKYSGIAQINTNEEFPQALYPYLSVEDRKKESLVGRFAIDIREADGGPDGDWDEPGDTGDPSYTLNVSVTGASSGSNSGIPLEAQEQTTYGSGGYGGNGGGGGAGASTVIIYEFATDKAETVNQEATAQGPGTGGPGGKGGKGGDGCILIFY